jgi:hypothetical protein
LLGKNPLFAAGVRNPGRNGFAIGKTFRMQQVSETLAGRVLLEKNLPFAAAVRTLAGRGLQGENPPFASVIRNPV